jgi:hypothetical protein
MSVETQPERANSSQTACNGVSHESGETLSLCQHRSTSRATISLHGYYLADGSHKVFPYDTDHMEFVKILRSPNGEDVAYIFHHRAQGSYSILQYNLIRREVQSPQLYNGFSMSENGRMVIFRAESEPSRIHAMQVIGQQLQAQDEICKPLRELVDHLRQLIQNQRQAPKYGEDGHVDDSAE